jgi:hypothetical protein
MRENETATEDQILTSALCACYALGGREDAPMGMAAAKVDTATYGISLLRTLLASKPGVERLGLILGDWLSVERVIAGSKARGTSW